MRISQVLVVTLTLLPVTACSTAPQDQKTTEAPPGSAELTIEGAVANLMPGGEQGAVYLTLINGTDQDDRLLSVSTDAAGVVETHETVTDGDMLRVESRPDGFAVPAGETVELAPSGKHILLMRLAEGLAEQGSLSLTLNFEQAGEQVVEVPVEALGGGVDHSEKDPSGMDPSGMGSGALADDGEDSGAEPPPATEDTPRSIH